MKRFAANNGLRAHGEASRRGMKKHDIPVKTQLRRLSGSAPWNEEITNWSLEQQNLVRRLWGQNPPEGRMTSEAVSDRSCICPSQIMPRIAPDQRVFWHFLASL
jgi:hypothetical protein